MTIYRETMALLLTVMLGTTPAAAVGPVTEAAPIVVLQYTEAPGAAGYMLICLPRVGPRVALGWELLAEDTEPLPDGVLETTIGRNWTPTHGGLAQDMCRFVVAAIGEGRSLGPASALFDIPDEGGLVPGVVEVPGLGARSADLNCDGRESIADALALLRYLVGMGELGGCVN